MESKEANLSLEVSSTTPQGKSSNDVEFHWRRADKGDYHSSQSRPVGRSGHTLTTVDISAAWRQKGTSVLPPPVILCLFGGSKLERPTKKEGQKLSSRPTKRYLQDVWLFVERIGWRQITIDDTCGLPEEVEQGASGVHRCGPSARANHVAVALEHTLVIQGGTVSKAAHDEHLRRANNSGVTEAAHPEASANEDEEGVNPSAALSLDDAAHPEGDDEEAPEERVTLSDMWALNLEPVIDAILANGTVVDTLDLPALQWQPVEQVNSIPRAYHSVAPSATGRALLPATRQWFCYGGFSGEEWLDIASTLELSRKQADDDESSRTIVAEWHHSVVASKRSIKLQDQLLACETECGVCGHSLLHQPAMMGKSSFGTPSKKKKPATVCHSCERCTVCWQRAPLCSHTSTTLKTFSLEKQTISYKLLNQSATSVSSLSGLSQQQHHQLVCGGYSSLPPRDAYTLLPCGPNHTHNNNKAYNHSQRQLQQPTGFLMFGGCLSFSYSNSMVLLESCGANEGAPQWCWSVLTGGVDCHEMQASSPLKQLRPIVVSASPEARCNRHHSHPRSSSRLGDNIQDGYRTPKFATPPNYSSRTPSQSQFHHHRSPSPRGGRMHTTLVKKDTSSSNERGSFEPRNTTNHHVSWGSVSPLRMDSQSSASTRASSLSATRAPGPPLAHVSVSPAAVAKSPSPAAVAQHQSPTEPVTASGAIALETTPDVEPRKLRVATPSISPPAPSALAHHNQSPEHRAFHISWPIINPIGTGVGLYAVFGGYSYKHSGEKVYGDSMVYNRSANRWSAVSSFVEDGFKMGKKSVPHSEGELPPRAGATCATAQAQSRRCRHCGVMCGARVFVFGGDDGTEQLDDGLWEVSHHAHGCGAKDHGPLREEGTEVEATKCLDSRRPQDVGFTTTSHRAVLDGGLKAMVGRFLLANKSQFQHSVSGVKH